MMDNPIFAEMVNLSIDFFTDLKAMAVRIIATVIQKAKQLNSVI